METPLKTRIASGSAQGEAMTIRDATHEPTTTAPERCPHCSRRLVTTRFDTTFRLPDGSERLCFGIPGSLCEDCHQLYVDPGLIELFDLGTGRCVFAIQSDSVMLEEAWSSAD
jgi:hypothetical protein